MNTAQQRQPLALQLSREMWEALTPKQQQDQRARFSVTVAPNYAPEHDRDFSKEVA